MAVHTGDIADDASPAATFRAAALLRGVADAVLAVPGNHDDPAVVAVAFPTGAVETGGWRVVGVDSSVAGAVAGQVDAACVAADLDRLARAGRRPTVLAIHHPPVSNSTHRWFQLAGASDLVTVLDAHPEVRVVLAGHTHERLDSPLGRHARLLGGPSSHYSIEHHGDRWQRSSAPIGAQLIELHPHGEVVSVTVIP